MGEPVTIKLGVFTCWQDQKRFVAVVTIRPKFLNAKNGPLAKVVRRAMAHPTGTATAFRRAITVNVAEVRS